MTPENSLVITKARAANPLVKLKIKRLKSVRSDQIHSSNKIILDTFTIRKKKVYGLNTMGPLCLWKIQFYFLGNILQQS